MTRCIERGCGLSLGWVTDTCDGFPCYSAEDGDAMLMLLRRLTQNEPRRPPAVLTFPVRASLVIDVGSAPVTALRRLQEMVTVELHVHSFFTFWRGRDEDLSEAQCREIWRAFPDATIDVD
jgi:hypothetical protein